MKEIESNITAFILAGGKSSRMGQDKGLMLLSGKPMTTRIIEKLEKIFNNVIIISNSESYNSFGKPVYSDLVKNAGPAGGILTALTHSKTELNFFCSCDTPLLSSHRIREICDHAKRSGASATVPSDGQRIHPLCAVYRRSNISAFETAIQKNEFKLREILKKLDPSIIEIANEENHFFNVNTLTEHQQAEKLISNGTYN